MQFVGTVNFYIRTVRLNFEITVAMNAQPRHAQALIPKQPTKKRLYFCLAGCLLLTWFPLAAQETGESDACADGVEAELCPAQDIGMDTDGSIDDAESSIGDSLEKHGWTPGGDLRRSYVHTDIVITDDKGLAVAGWLGILTGIVWVLAAIWAYMKPAGSQAQEIVEPSE